MAPNTTATDDAQTTTDAITEGDRVTFHRSARRDDGHEYGRVVEGTVVEVTTDYVGKPMVRIDYDGRTVTELVSQVRVVEDEDAAETDGGMLDLLDDEAADDGVSLSLAGTRTLARRYDDEGVETTVYKIEATTPAGDTHTHQVNAVRIGCRECKENTKAVIQGGDYRCICGYSNTLTRETLLRQGAELDGEWVPY